MYRRQFVREPWESLRWSSEEDQQQLVPVQAAVSRRERAASVGTLSFSKHRELQPSHAASSRNEGSFGEPLPSVRPGGRAVQPQPQSRRENQWGCKQEMLSRRAAMVVCVCWLDTGDCNECCVRVFYHDVWADIRERPLHKLAYLHDGFLLWESLHHPTFKGDIWVAVVMFWRKFKKRSRGCVMATRLCFL